ncbi:MAG: AI-2E family transporter [Bacteroidota bacterium]
MDSNNTLKLSFFTRASIFILGLIAFITMLSIGRSIIIPLVFAIIISIILHPVVNFLVGLKINRIISIIITLFISLLICATLARILISQIIRFSESWEALVEKFNEMNKETISWISQYFNIYPQKIHVWIAETKTELFDTGVADIGKTLVILGNGLVVVFLIPVYVFMILFYHPIIIEFFRRLFGANNRSEVSKIISEIKTLIQRYLIGLSMEVLIIATLFSVGLLLLGIEYAIILGVIGALLNLIPYIGAIIGAILPMIIAIITKPSPWYALLVLALYIFIQFIDNNFIIPKIVASKVKINALFTIIAVILFGMLWGIPGMFLAIPLTAIIKLIFDHVDILKPWGFLLGDTMPPLIPFPPGLKKVLKRTKL